jgi:hypothetical protein
MLFTSVSGCTLALGFLLSAPSAALAQMTPILRSDIRAATAPNYGCDGWHTGSEGIYYRQTRITSGSPSGRDSIRFEAIGTTRNDVQFQWGCLFDSSLEPTPPQGATRYVRWRVKVISPVYWYSNWAGGSSTGDKMFILGNNCENSPYMPTRMIVKDGTTGPSFNNPMLGISQNIGPGSGDRAIPIDQWANVQFRIRSSSSADTSDGRVDLYINNNNEASPTASGTGILIKTAGWGRNTCSTSWMLWGNGSFRAMATGGSHRLEIADFEYDDQFDPSWAIGSAGGSALPSPPTNLRILSSLLSLPFGALGFIVLWRRKQ